MSRTGPKVGLKSKRTRDAMRNMDEAGLNMISFPGPLRRAAPIEPMPPPEWLCQEAKEKWIDLAPQLQVIDLLTPVDSDMFGAYCQAFAIWMDAERKIASGEATVFQESTRGPWQQKSIWESRRVESMNTCIKLSALFGLSPVDRLKLAVDPNRRKRKISDGLEE